MTTDSLSGSCTLFHTMNYIVNSIMASNPTYTTRIIPVSIITLWYHSCLFTVDSPTLGKPAPASASELSEVVDRRVVANAEGTGFLLVPFVAAPIDRGGAKPEDGDGSASGDDFTLSVMEAGESSPVTEDSPGLFAEGVGAGIRSA